MNEMKNAALYESCNEYFLYVGGQSGKTQPIIPPARLELFIPILEQNNLDSLWVMPGNSFSQNISWADFDRIDREHYKVFYPEKNGKPITDKPTFVSIRKKSDHWEKEYFLSFPEHGEWSAENKGQWYLPAPYILGLTINYLKREFGREILWGPGNLGMKELKAVHEKKGWQIENLVLTDPIENMLNQAVSRPVWRKWGGLSPDQAQMLFAHGFDKNSQFLGGAQSSKMGNGQPEWVGPEAFDLGLTGFWEYRLVDIGDSVFDGYDLPCPLSVKASCASTQLLLAAKDFNIEFEILRGLVWAPEQTRKYLEEWAKNMRKYRTNLRNPEQYISEIARENAELTAKAAANNMMGRLAKPGSRELFRPDWNWLIVHQAIANQMHSFNKIQRDYNIKPVLVTTDSWWIVSDEPDPAKAIPDILKYQHEQRGYKHIGTARMTPEIVDAFATELPEDINTLLKREVVCYA